MDIQQRAAAALAALQDISKHEALKIVTDATMPPGARQAALLRVKRASDGYAAIIAALPGGADPVGAAMADCALTFVETVIRFSPSADMRAAQFEGYRRLEADHAKAVGDARAGIGTDDVAAVLAKIGKAANVMRKVAKNPADFMGVLQFWNKIARPDPGLSQFQLLPDPARPAPTFNDLVDNDFAAEEVFTEYRAAQLPKAQADQIMRALQLTAEDLQTAAQWLGAAVVLITVTTVVLNTIADERHWASTLAKGTFAVGLSLALSQAVTAATVAPAVTALVSAAAPLFGAGAATVEVPPVAFVLIAVGIVVVVGIAVNALFDLLLDAVVGGDIPRSMRTEMAMPMAASMRMQMAMPMSTPLS